MSVVLFVGCLFIHLLHPLPCFFRGIAPRIPVVSYALGLCFEHGLGTTINMLEAEGHYAEAAAQGHSAAQYNYGVFLHEGLVQRERKKEKEGVRRKAKTLRAPIFPVYLQGARRNREEARRWFRLAASQGNEVLAQTKKKKKKKRTGTTRAEEKETSLPPIVFSFLLLFLFFLILLLSYF